MMFYLERCSLKGTRTSQDTYLAGNQRCCGALYCKHDSYRGRCGLLFHFQNANSSDFQKPNLAPDWQNMYHVLLVPLAKRQSGCGQLVHHVWSKKSKKPSQDISGPSRFFLPKNRHKNRNDAPSPGPEAPAGLRLPELHGFRWPGADPGFNVLSPKP